MICINCEYYQPLGNAGHCHRFPPNQDGKGTSTIDEFPMVKEDDWCGEHKKKGKKK